MPCVQYYDPLFDIVMKTAQSPKVRPAADIVETKDAYRLAFNLPGVKKHEIALKIEDGHLIVEREPQPEAETEQSKEHDERVLHRERADLSRFKRVFQLPDDAHSDGAQATHEDGVLTVTLSKKAPSVHPLTIN